MAGAQRAGVPAATALGVAMDPVIDTRLRLRGRLLLALLVTAAVATGIAAVLRFLG